MQQAIDNGTPVNPPIWWIDPTNVEAHKINDGKNVQDLLNICKQLFLFIDILDKSEKYIGL